MFIISKNPCPKSVLVVLQEFKTQVEQKHAIQYTNFKLSSPYFRTPLTKKTIHEITRTETARHKHPKTHVQGPPCALFCASVILSGTQRQRGALHQIGQRFGNDRMCESRIS